MYGNGFKVVCFYSLVKKKSQKERKKITFTCDDLPKVVIVCSAVFDE